jgi:hypothetical protein
MDCFDCWFGLREFWKLFATQRVINRLTGTAAFDLNVIAGESFAGDFSRRNMGLTTDGISAAAFSPECTRAAGEVKAGTMLQACE